VKFKKKLKRKRRKFVARLRKDLLLACICLPKYNRKIKLNSEIRFSTHFFYNRERENEKEEEKIQFSCRLLRREIV
jgi:hypothetical protein